MKVQVLFFGVLAEVTGTSLKIYSGVKSTGDLELKVRDDFPEIAHYNYRISLNSVLTEGETLLKDGDELAFMPPFAGG